MKGCSWTRLRLGYLRWGHLDGYRDERMKRRVVDIPRRRASRREVEPHVRLNVVLRQTLALVVH